MLCSIDYKNAKEKLVNGAIVHCINWVWCLYDTEEVANKVKAACEAVSPTSTISDVHKTTYKGVTAYGFCVHK